MRPDDHTEETPEEIRGDSPEQRVMEIGPLLAIATEPLEAPPREVSSGAKDSDDRDAEPAVVGGLEKIRSVPYDPSKQRELMRGTLAMSLVGILALIVLLSFVLIWPDAQRYATPGSASGQISGQVFMVQDPQGDTTSPPTVPEGTVLVPQSPLQELLTLIFTPIIGLVGAVTGFYYGGETAKGTTGA